MHKPTIIFLDVNETLLDLEPARMAVSEALDGRRDLSVLWFSTLLHHSTVMALARRYEDFGKLGVLALEQLAAANGIGLDHSAAVRAVGSMLELPAHEDVPPALAAMRESGLRPVALTNSGQDAAETQLANAGLREQLEAVLSVESVGTYKPDPRVYAWAAETFGVDVDTAMLVAAHGWDVAGALWAGMRSVLIQRPGKRSFPLGPKPERIVPDFTGLQAYLQSLQ